MDIDKAALNDQISKAIDAHEVWKIRLREAIEKGTSEYTVEDLSASNLCAFGRWLYLEIGSILRDKQYEKVRDLHQSFHMAAASVLNLALAGRQEEARAAMEAGSEYVRLSSGLISAMKQWRDLD